MQRHNTFAEIIEYIIPRVIQKKMSGQKAREAIHNWYNELTAEEKAKFKAEQQDNEYTLNFYKQAIATIEQELPFLYMC